MSIISDVKQLFRQPSERVAPTALAPTLSGAMPTEIGVLPWDATLGSTSSPLQERLLSYHNDEVTGNCQGSIQRLTGSAMVCVFEDLPAWMNSLLVRLSVAAEAGTLTVTICQADGSLLTLTAPALLDADVALGNGQLRFRCEAGEAGVRGIHYQVSII